MRTCTTYPSRLWLWFLLLFFSPPLSQAAITFRIFTGGPLAGQVHIDSPEGLSVFFREGGGGDAPPNGFCGIRWAGDAGDIIWYWGDPGRMDFLPGNGEPATQLSYQAPYSSCFGKTPARYETPGTPDGAPPPGAYMLVVEVPGWQHASFINAAQGRLRLADFRNAVGETDICRHWPGFCDAPPVRLPPDPCRYAAHQDLICQVLPTARLGLIQASDLLNAFTEPAGRAETDCLDNLYRKGGQGLIRKSLSACRDRLELVRLAFQPHYAGYRHLDSQVKAMNSLPLSHYAYAAASMHLDLANLFLQRCQEQLAAIEAAAEQKQGWQPRGDFQTLEMCRQRAGHHLAAAQLWIGRQQAWVLPLER